MKNINFNTLLITQGLSEFGSQISYLAIPLYAVYILRVTPLQMGILNAMEGLPAVLIGLIAAPYVEKASYNKVMLHCDIWRFLLLSIIPCCYLINFNSIYLLLTIIFLVACSTSIFNLAFWSLVPTIVTIKNYTSANSKITIITSLAETAGPAIAGSIISILGAPVSIFIDALTFLCSGLTINKIKIKKTDGTENIFKQISLIKDIKESIESVFKNKVLLYLMLGGLLWNYVHFVFITVLIIYYVKILHLSSTFIGIITASAGIGSILGSTSTNWINKKYDSGKLLVISQILGISIYSLVPYLNFAGKYNAFLIALCMFFTEFFSSINNVIYLSMRQLYTPKGIQTRVVATMRILTWGIVPFAAILSGILADQGLRLPMIVGGTSGVFLSLIWGYRSKYLFSNLK